MKIDVGTYEFKRGDTVATYIVHSVAKKTAHVELRWWIEGLNPSLWFSKRYPLELLEVQLSVCIKVSSETEFKEK